jgi:hypothetical protein
MVRSGPCVREGQAGHPLVADEELERARAGLVALAGHAREEGAGVAVTRFWKAGNVDYKKVVELRGVDLEVYRGKGREEVRVSIAL